MKLSKFDKAFSNLTELFHKKGYYKNPNKEQANVFGKIVDYQIQLMIITGRLETDIEMEKAHEKYIFDSLKENKNPDSSELRRSIINVERLRLDLSDFFIYTRMFLDALTVSVKLSLQYVGIKNACLMKNSVRCLLNVKMMKNYKEKISLEFFEDLEKRVRWVADFRNKRDGLVHKYHYFVLTNNRQGELGYDVIDEVKNEWGTDTVKAIRADLQNTIDNLSELIEFIYQNLPKA
jgi:hypothetical protein